MKTKAISEYQLPGFMNSMPSRLPGQCLFSFRGSTPKVNFRELPPSDAALLLRGRKPCTRVFTISSFRSDVEPEKYPRWQRTPERMTAPFRSKPPVFGNEFRVNDDPERLDRVYVRLFGGGGDRLLSEEVKWLAITHKSFDHGRRGFNDRLSFLGKRIVHLQTSLALFHSYSATSSPPPPDQFEREPFEHPSLDGLRGLTNESKSIIDQHQRLAQLAEKYGLNHVIRWKPKNSRDLRASGYQLVYAQTVFAIIGALALERGGEVANRIARERILQPLGLES